MEQYIPMGCFREQGNTFRGIPFFFLLLVYCSTWRKILTGFSSQMESAPRVGFRPTNKRKIQTSPLPLPLTTPTKDAKMTLSFVRGAGFGREILSNIEIQASFSSPIFHC